MSKPTGRPIVDSFLAELDRRIADPDYPAARRGTLRQVRPALRLLAENGTADFERALLKELEPGGLLEAAAPESP
jgi:hypothetical protein